MDRASNESPLADVFANLQCPKIAELTTNNATLSNSYVEATVILVWPYSSSSRKLSFLLAQQDVRLRQHVGQVKVTFLGECAKEVARLHAGIGDGVRLSLQDAVLSQSDEAISTPGKKLGWDLEFHRNVTVEITRDNEVYKILQFHASSKSPNGPGPAGNAIHKTNGYHGSATSYEPAVSITTPAFRTPRKTSAGGYTGLALVPLPDDVLFDQQRSNKRTKFSRPSNSWRVLDDDDDDDDDSGEAEPLSRQENTFTPSDPAIGLESALNGASAALEDHQNSIVSTGVFEPLPSVDVPPIEATHEFQSITIESPYEKFAEMVSISPTEVSIPLVSTYSTTTARPEDEVHSSVVPSAMDVIAPTEPLVASTVSESTTSNRLQEYKPGDSRLDSYSLGAEQIPTALPQPAQVSQMYLDDVQVHDPIQDSAASHSQPFSNMDTTPTFSADNTGLGEGFVDLEALEQEVDRHSARMDAMPLLDVDMEDPDMYGPPATPIQHHGNTLLFRTSTAEQVTDHLESPRVVDHNLYPGHGTTTEEGSPSQSFSSQPRYPRFDSIEDEYESESARLHRREQVTAAKTSVVIQEPVIAALVTPELVEISSDDEDEYGGKENDAEQSTVPKARIIDDAGDAASSFIQKELTSASVPAPPPPPQEEMNEVRIDGDQTSHLTPTSDYVISEQKGQETEVQQGPTPAASQETFLAEAVDQLQHTDSWLQLPLSPILTQHAPTSSFIEHTQQSQEPQLPDRPIYTENNEDEQVSHLQAREPWLHETESKSTSPQSDNIVRVDAQYYTDGLESEIVPTSPAEARYSRQSSVAIVPTNLTEVDEVEERLKPEASTSTPHRGLSTAHSYYPKLISLHDFYGLNVDTIVVCAAGSARPEKAKSGPRDFYTTIHVSDMSLDERTTVTIRLFRPKISALPVVRAGEVILLRNMKVQTQNGKMMLLSTETSAWAVFRDASEGQLEASMNGPPVEYGPAEVDYVTDLTKWWVVDATKRDFPVVTRENLLEKQVKNGMEDSKVPPLRTRRTRRKPSDLSLDMTAAGASSANQRTNEAGIQPEMVKTPATMLTRSQSRKNKLEKTESVLSATSTTNGVETFDFQPGRATSTQNIIAQPLAFPESPTSTRATGEELISPSIDSSTTSRHVAPGEAADATASASASRSKPARQSRRQHRKTKSLVHELRDGTKYTDEAVETKHKRQHGRTRSGSTHELRDGAKYKD